MALPYKEAVLATAGLVSLWDTGAAAGAYPDLKDSNPGEGSGTITRGQASLLPNGEGNCALFDGTTGFISVPTAANLQLGDTVSLEAWVKLTALGAERVLIDLGTNSLQMLVRSENKLWMRQAGVVLIGSSTSTLDEKGHHLVVGKSGSTRKVYIDAVDVTSLFSEATLAASTTVKTIGRLASASSNFAKGYVQYPAVYNALLSEATVKAHLAAASQATAGSVLRPIRRGRVVNP